MKRDASVKLDLLGGIFAGHHNMLVVLQNFPDPDAIGAACALKELARRLSGIQTSVACSGVVGRSANRALIRYLGLNLLTMPSVDIDAYDLVAMVDTQPGTGNNALPHDRIPDVVIDHHPIRPQTRKSPFYDVRRRYGATSTILHEYLLAAGVTPDMPLATALAFGIRSDTDDLGREASKMDVDALLALYPAANKRKLRRIDAEVLPRAYFNTLYLGLHNAETFGPLAVTHLGVIDNPDMIGEVADLLLRDEESVWAMCCGVYDGWLLVSIRTSDPDKNAGHIARRLAGRRGTGGGHASMAGGQLPIGDTVVDTDALERRLIRRFLRLMGAKEKVGAPLIAGLSPPRADRHDDGGPCNPPS